MPSASRQSGSTGGAFARFGLVRPAADRKVAGVCAAIGRATDTDPLLWRVVLAVLVVFAGAGLVLYGLGWVLFPSEGDRSSALEALFGRSTSSLPKVPTALLTLAAVSLAVVTIGDTGGRPFLVFVALVLALGALARRTELPPVPPVTPPAPDPAYRPPFAPAGPFATGRVDPTTTMRLPAEPYAPAPTRRLDAAPDETLRLPAEPPVDAPVTAPPATTPTNAPVTAPPVGPYWAPPPPPPQPRPPAGAPRPARRRSRLGVVTVALIAAAMSVMSIVAMSGASVPFSAFVAVALTLCGLGLVVGTWWGRSPSLYVLGSLLSILMVLTMLVQGAGISGFGQDQRIRPDSVAEVPATLSTSFGSTTVDLSELWINEDVSIDVEAIAGTVTILVDPAVDVILTAEQAFTGSVSLEGQEIAGFGGGELTSVGADGGGTLTVTVEVIAGSVEVER